jgi:FkbM family methyltransferase
MLIQTPRNRSVIRRNGRYPRALNVLSRKQTAVQRQLRREGLAGYEPVTQATLLTLVQLAPRPAEFFDVGAHIGLYSALIAAVYGPQTVRVTAFEPTPDVADICARIATENALALHLERCAISAEDGEATLFLSNKTESSNSLEAGFKPSSASITVPVTTLDTYCERSGHLPNVMKIDVETHEAKVLSGAMNVIERARPWLVCELLAKADPERTAAALDRLAGLGYRMHRWAGDAWQETPSSEVLDHTTGSDRDWLITPDALPATFGAAFQEWRAAISLCTNATNRLLPAGDPLPHRWQAPYHSSGARIRLRSLFAPRQVRPR